MKLQTDRELSLLDYWLKKTRHVLGDCVEVGVYMGYSAQTIALSKDPSKKLYLFDTFSGFGDTTEDERVFLDSFFDYHDSYNKVMSLNLPNTEVVKGFFPESSNLEDGKVFSFVHLDVDTYNSTLEGLKYFYPRLSEGGVIVIHDYIHKQLNVKNAVSDYNKDLFVFTSDTSQGFLWK